MYLKIFIICLPFLGGTFASDPKLHDELGTCLSTAVEKLCPDCVTLYLVLPTKPSWQADALVDHFTDSSPTYALTISTMDRSGYEHPLADNFGLYLVNSAADMTMSLKHLRGTKSSRNYVIWVNLRFGCTFGDYLKAVIPPNWDRGNALSLIFVALVDDDVQVLGTLVQKSGSYNVDRLRKLTLCDTKALIEVPQPIEKVIESRKLILTVIVRPKSFPFLERQTDSPGGFIANFMNVLSKKLNFTPKYNWSYGFNDVPMLKAEMVPYVALNFLAIPKIIPPSFSSMLVLEAFWIIATDNSIEQTNILVMPLRNNISLHLIILTIYTGVMIYLSRDLDKTRITLRLFGMFFGVGIGWLPKKGLFRCLVVLWCFTTYVLLQAYLSALTSELSYPITHESFRTVEDLMKFKVRVFCAIEIKELYCNLRTEASKYICEKCENNDEWLRQLYKNNSQAWEIPRPFAFHANLHLIKSHFSSSDEQLKKIPERIGMWSGLIYSNADARFMKSVKKISRQLMEAGIAQYWHKRHYIQHSNSYEHQPRMLNTSHLNDMIIILYVGWFCSIVILLIEILGKW